MRLTADYPPVWLAGFAAIGWAIGRLAPHGPAWLAPLGALMVVLALALMGLAAWRMGRARTTIDPHGAPSRLVTDGVFALSRNPIYLADAAILAGLCLWWQAPVAAIGLVPGFVTVVTRRFIRPEEARLAALFPAEFAIYRREVRRWL